MRFHFGVSFRWRSIKKFLLPFLIGILSFFGLSKFNILQVNAASNFNTYFNITYPETDKFDEDFTSDKTYKEFIDSLIPSESEYFYYYVYSDYGSSFWIYLIPKNNNQTYVNMFVYNKTFRLWWNNQSYYKYFIFSDLDTLPYSQREGITEFQNCFYDNNCPSSNYTSEYGAWGYYKSGQVNSANPLSLFYYHGNETLDNDHSYTIPVTDVDITHNGWTFNMVYKTDYPLLMNPTMIRNGTNTSSYLYKNVILNDIELLENVQFPSYYDLFYSSEPEESLSLPYYLDDLGTFFIGSIPKENLGSLTSTISFNFSGLENISSIRYNILYFGRINHSDNYFSYEKINCNPLNIVSSAIGVDHVITTFFPDGLTCSSDLTNYDNIYIQLQPYNYVSTDKSIYNLQMTSTYGNIARLSNSVVTYNPVYIFEKFDNLPSDFSFLFSSLEPKQIIYYLSNNEYLVSLDVDMSTNEIGSLDIKYFGTDYNKNLMLFNMSNYYSGTTNLDLFLQPDTILSIYNDDSYSYYDDNGNIVDSNIINNKNVSKEDNYNVDNYFDVINNYINDLNDDLVQFSSVVQTVYNSIPNTFQILIFIGFILGCIYLVYLFMRW